jgi:hypothetical protein
MQRRNKFLLIVLLLVLLADNPKIILNIVNTAIDVINIFLNRLCATRNKSEKCDRE